MPRVVFSDRNLTCPGRLRCFALALFLFLGLLADPLRAGEAAFTELGLQSQDGRVHVFKAEIAATPEMHARGLMFRRELAANAGMLFDFHQSQHISMWMKNTLIPLDMLFIAKDGQIVNIAQRTIPGSLTPIPSDKPVRFVLEINGGTASRLGLKSGDRAIRGLPE